MRDQERLFDRGHTKTCVRACVSIEGHTFTENLEPAPTGYPIRRSKRAEGEGKILVGIRFLSISLPMQ